MSTIEIGYVKEAAIYPVKGMQGVSRGEVSIRSISVVGDRSRAYVLPDSHAGNLFLDTIKFPGLLQYAPYLENPTNPKESPVRVKTPSGYDYSADSTELEDEISEGAKRKVQIFRMGRAAYHSMPVSVLSTASVGAIEEVVGHEVDHRRFRENIMIETNSDEPYQEDRWLGKLLTFGERPDSAKLAVVKLDSRCATVNFNPETGKQDPDILRAIVKEHERTLGVYCGPIYQGTIRRGDPIYLTDIG